MTGAWHRLARSIMRRPLLWCIAAAAVMGALALPALGVELTVGDNRGTAATTEATYGQRILERSLGPGALAPHQLVVDAQRPGGAGEAGVRVAARRVIAALQADPEIAPGAAPAAVADREGRILEIRAAGRSDPGSQAAIDLVHRIRDQHVPAAGFPPDTDVLLTGTAAYGVDFIDKSYTALPWLVLGVLAISYVLLLRAFRSVVLPAKAVLMNLLSVGATLGVLVLVFQHGWGSPLGLEQTPQIEAWIPIFLFALLFGLSMDYEVFLLARVREEWDKSADNQHAVAVGLEQTGRIITAAAIIMIAAFSGLVAGSFVGLQQFGVGLAAAIFLDATVVRAVLVPATMRLLGRWNWYVPERHFRLVTGPWYRKQPQEPS